MCVCIAALGYPLFVLSRLCFGIYVCKVTPVHIEYPSVLVKKEHRSPDELGLTKCFSDVHRHCKNLEH